MADRVILNESWQADMIIKQKKNTLASWLK